MKTILILFGLTLMFFQISLIIVHHSNLLAVVINLIGVAFAIAATIKALIGPNK